MSPKGVNDDVVVRLPPVDELAMRWREIEPFLRRATRRAGYYEPVDVLFSAMQGQTAIWLIEIGGSATAAIATEIRQYPRCRVLEVMFAGGDGLSVWMKKLTEALDEYARQMKCTRIACLGRPGWARAWGAKPTGEVMLVREVS